MTQHSLSPCCDNQQSPKTLSNVLQGAKLLCFRTTDSDIDICSLLNFFQSFYFYTHTQIFNDGHELYENTVRVTVRGAQYTPWQTMERLPVCHGLLPSHFCAALCLLEKSSLPCFSYVKFHDAGPFLFSLQVPIFLPTVKTLLALYHIEQLGFPYSLLQPNT